MSLVGDMFIMICWLLPFLFCSLELLFARDDDKPCVNRVIITLFLPLVCSGVAFYSLYINVGDVFFYWYMPAGYFSAVFLTGYLTGMGYIFLPKFTQTGSNVMPTVKLSLTISRVKRQQHTVGVGGKGNTETGLRVARLGCLSKPWKRMGSTYHPITHSGCSRPGNCP